MKKRGWASLNFGGCQISESMHIGIFTLYKGYKRNKNFIDLSTANVD